MSDQATGRPERKYALTRIKSGDYLLPSNDATTLWRLTSYEEDGSGEVSADGKTWRRLTGTHWQVSRFKRPISPDGDVPDGFLDWENWEHWAGAIPTRKDAIAKALRA